MNLMSLMGFWPKKGGDLVVSPFFALILVGETSMPLFDVSVNSYLGCDTRIKVTQQRTPKPLDRDAENETSLPEPVSGSPQTEARTGRKGATYRNRLSTHARQSLQRIGGAVDCVSSAWESVFLTGTFPGETALAQSAIARQAGKIVHALKAWIYKRIGANVGYYVWEFQRRGTLHLHYVVLVPEPTQRENLIRDFRAEWIRLVDSAGKREGVNLFEGRKGRNYWLEQEKLQIYAQECYKGCASYLSKYLSKSKEHDFPAPCRLWGCTREARHLVARNLVSWSMIGLHKFKAEDLAHSVEAESSALPQKRRYFRHRFSQGFTILLYDDSIRESQRRRADFMVKSKLQPWSVKVISLVHSLQDMGAWKECWEFLSPTAKWDLAYYLPGQDKSTTAPSTQRLYEALLELRCAFEFATSLSWRQKWGVKNRIAIIIVEALENADVSFV